MRTAVTSGHLRLLRTVRYSNSPYLPKLLQPMTDDRPTVIVIDDDPSIRKAIDRLLRSVGLRVELFESAQEFLQSDRPDAPSCIVLDVRLPGQSGLNLQRNLAAADIRIPIIFITAHGDIPMSVRAMKAGAVEFLTKPFHDQDLLDAIEAALEKDRARRADEKLVAELKKRFETLTARERQVMHLVVAGRLNKQIAAELGISEMTVKIHRGQVFHKMQAVSLPDLVRMADKSGITKIKE
jgi:FixJ family two-component response regulator